MKVFVVTACYNEYECYPEVIGVTSEQYRADVIIADFEAAYRKRTKNGYEHQKYGYTYDIEEWEVQ